jgi:hypothetical protein
VKFLFGDRGQHEKPPVFGRVGNLLLTQMFRNNGGQQVAHPTASTPSPIC